MNSSATINSTRKRTNLDRSDHSLPCSPPSASSMDFKELSSLLSKMQDPTPAATAIVHRKRRRRAAPLSVSFAEDAFLYPSERLIEDLEESWYSKDDLASFKKERKAVIRALKRVGFDTNAVDKQKYCLRGYEPYFSIEVNKALKHSRAMLTSTVLSEQKRQKMLNIYELETIRDCSCNESARARHSSHELGVLDSLECFALTLNLDALPLQAPITGIIRAQSMSMSSQAKTQEKSQLENDVKLLGHSEHSTHSAPGAFHVDCSPEQGKGTKMRFESSCSSIKPGAYHVDYRQPVSKLQDELSMRGPEHRDHESVADHLQQIRYSFIARAG
jgi:hypothetical protein